MIEYAEMKPRNIVDEAVRRLVSTSHFISGSIVSMPVTYPSGTSVALEITIQSGRCFVSDRAGGFQDAEMSGAARYFGVEARRIAEGAGIRFDGRDMFVAEVPAENLHGAMVVVANASAEAAATSILRASERSDKEATDQLYDRLASIYRTKDVQKDAQLIGQSNHKWRVSVLVIDGLQQWMFEPVTGNYLSAVSTAAKFHDFAAKEHAPLRAAVIKSREDMKDYFGLVVGASTKVLTRTDSDETFLKLLQAA